MKNPNGARLGGAQMIGAKMAAESFKFGEEQFRQALIGIRNAAVQHGSLPCIDPLGTLGLGILMDKIDAMNKRLDDIASRLPPNFDLPAKDAEAS